MESMEVDFAHLGKDLDQLVSSLSNSAHEAMQLTMEHTSLYNDAVGVLQARRHCTP